MKHLQIERSLSWNVKHLQMISRQSSSILWHPERRQPAKCYCWRLLVNHYWVRWFNSSKVLRRVNCVWVESFWLITIPVSHLNTALTRGLHFECVQDCYQVVSCDKVERDLDLCPLLWTRNSSIAIYFNNVFCFQNVLQQLVRLSRKGIFIVLSRTLFAHTLVHLFW